MNTENLDVIKKSFVTKEIAEKLKEKGFDFPVIALYDFRGYFTLYDYELRASNLICPLFSQVTDWLEEKHQIFIDIETDCTTYPKFAYSINKFVGNPKDLAEKEWYWEHPKPDNWFLYRTRNEALEEAIKFALTLI